VLRCAPTSKEERMSGLCQGLFLVQHLQVASQTPEVLRRARHEANQLETRRPEDDMTAEIRADGDDVKIWK
jgi:hypothetical protein